MSQTITRTVYLNNSNPDVVTFAVPGAVAGKAVTASIAYAGKGLTYYAYCETDGEVKVVLNMTSYGQNYGTIGLNNVPISFDCAN